ncbi:MAG TPA: ribonuclease E inhibitor RraB, partial [Polyangium sp.]|nr:ribonuclease E inhibitor RraB [Polyangium sp.]
MKKTEKKIKYREGDWFGVPLEKGGWAVGIVARKWRNDSFIAYFFGPPRQELPKDTKELDQLHHSQAAHCAVPGILGLRWGTWPIIGHHARWHRDLFPNPWFGWVAGGGKKAARKQYDENIYDYVLEDCSVEEALQLPSSDIPGDKAVECILGPILAGTRRIYGDPRPGTLWWTDKFPPPAEPHNPNCYPVPPPAPSPITTAQTDNALVLQAMTESSDMAKPHTIVRRFYFASKDDAQAAKKALAKRLYHCERIRKSECSPERPWYLEAYHRMVPTAENVDREDEAI